MNIKERRKELGMSQAELGKKVGLSQQHVQRIENGYEIGSDLIPLFSKALQVPIYELLPDNLKYKELRFLRTEICLKQYVDIDSRLQKFETPDQFADFFCKCAESQKKNQQCFGDCDKRTDQQR